MTERLLQFIWRFQYFNHHELHTETGEFLHIISPGEINNHQGPDFLLASIRIGSTSWVGNIELHLLASDWKKHAHGKDKNYNNVVLHVVWENDLHQGLPEENNGSLPGENNSFLPGENRKRDIPVLVLRHRVPKLLLSKYGEWMISRSFVACEHQLQQVGEAKWSEWKHKLLEERLQRRTLFIQDCLQQNNQHWEETTWWLLARNFGIPANTGPFGAIAKSLPVSILARHRDRPEQLEALLLGQAGILGQDFKEDYPVSLQKEFRYLRAKYRLPPIHEPVLFLRMRPANFPSVRLAQLAMLLHQSSSLFARIKEADSLKELKELWAVTAGSYWDRHYVWEEESSFKRKTLGQQMKDSIIINTLTPLLFAYGSLRREKAYRDKALRWLEETKAEKNTQTAGWARLGVGNCNAAHSQALLELKTRYCDPKKCLECAIGKELLGKTMG